MNQYNWSAVSKECRDLVKLNAMKFCELVNSQPLAPLNDDFILQLFSIQIKTKDPIQLKNLLFDQYKIEIPVMPHGDRVFLRYSIQAFNTQGNLDTLYNAISDIIKTTNLIEID
jgi:isopenicillin-N epimerase